jgi:nucleotide-binding universal stress UspA family protein
MRILIPLDGSEGAEAAVGAVMPLIRAFSANVSLLHMLEEDETAREAAASLERVADGLRAQGIGADIHVRSEKPSEEILAMARDSGADLIAMSTHGRTGLARVLVGSVTEEVLRRAEVPVFVCRPGVAPATFGSVLVALDGSDRAEEVLPDAVSVARALKVPVLVLRVAPPIVTAGGLGEFGMVVPSEDPMPYLRKVCWQIAAEGVEARPVARTGHAAGEILRYAEEGAAGMICMTTHGRGGLTRFILGSIAEEVLRHAPCPALVRRMATAPRPAGAKA